jgi:hypothetical protein
MLRRLPLRIILRLSACTRRRGEARCADALPLSPRRHLQVCGPWGGFVHLQQYITDMGRRVVEGGVRRAREALRLHKKPAGGGKLNEARQRRRALRPELTYELAHFIVATGEDVYLKMLLVDQLMHADLVSRRPLHTFGTGDDDG